jgi:hypothetical protein
MGLTLMKKLIVSALAVLCAVAVPAFAEPKADAAKAEAKKVDIPADYWKRQKPTQFLAKDRLIGQQVKNKEGKVIGDIEDLIVGDENKVVGVIMGVGGFLGAGEKKVAVRLRALQFSAVDGKKVITLPSATKEVLTALLPYERVAPPKSMVEKMKDKAIELKDKTVETSKEAAAKAKDAAAPAMEKAKDMSKAAVDKAKELAAPKAATPAAAKP